MTQRGRAAAIAAILLSAAAIGVARLSVSPRLHDTCSDRRALFDVEQLDFETVAVTVRGGPRSGHMDGYLDSAETGVPLAFTIRRTFQLPNWLIRPTTALPGPKEPDRFETHEIEVDGKTVYARFAYAMHRHHERFAAYTLAYEGESTLSAFWLRVLEAPIAVIQGVRPITYIGVASDSSLKHLPEQEERALKFIEAAWRHYERACRP